VKSSGGKPRILVVEDSATQAAALAEQRANEISEPQN